MDRLIKNCYQIIFYETCTYEKIFKMEEQLKKDNSLKV